MRHPAPRSAAAAALMWLALVFAHSGRADSGLLLT